jgi:hypothetical protein
MKRFLEIRFGRDAKMYTLWSVLIGERHVIENYIKNLSTNYEKALKLADEFNENNLEIEIDAPEKLFDIVRGS